MNRNSQFGNCAGCGSYKSLVLDGMCAACARKNQEQLDTAIFYAESKPDSTAQEIAEYLEIPESRVVHWALEGRLECIFLEKDCESCDYHMVNQLVCPQCGTAVEHDIELEEEPNTLDQRSARVVFLESKSQHRHHHR